MSKNESCDRCAHRERNIPSVMLPYPCHICRDKSSFKPEPNNLELALARIVVLAKDIKTEINFELLLGEIVLAEKLLSSEIIKRSKIELEKGGGA